MDNETTVSPEEVGAAAQEFVDGLVTAFGVAGTTTVSVDGVDIAVDVEGEDLGRLVGPKGRTLVALQDLARVASQRRLGDHETRLKVDIGGYRVRRQEALVRFTKSVAETVRETGEARSLEPMASPDRKIVHDVLNDEPGVSSRSEGEDPHRRVVVVPA